jgi:uncharacterized membrane protein
VTETRPTGRDDAITGGVLLGLGLGGFVDGIVLHQILQWHHMLTDYGDYDRFPPGNVADLEDNSLWDGLFHAGTWVLTVVGLVILIGAARRGRSLTLRELVGLLLMGWGLFNLVEGTIDHHLVTLHHVRDDVAEPLWWDLGFLVLGAALVVSGLVLWRGRRSEPDPPGRNGLSL